MIYILTILAIICVICLFIETELQKCSVTYKNSELKIIKYKVNRVVYRKVIRGKNAELIYKFFC